MSSEWKKRRFWQAAEPAEIADGWEVLLDGRPLRTPAKAPLHLPTRALALAIAAEWDAQDEIIDPGSMPVTRAANSAIDKVRPQRVEVVEMLAAYGDSDLLCYRAPGPEGLVERQTLAWEPLLDWAAARYGARLIPVQGVMHAAQPKQALDRLAAPLADLPVFALTGMHDLVTLSGSLVLGLAAADGFDAPEALWELSRIDETWQQELWGVDEEAAEMAADRRAAFLRAADFYRMAK